MKLEEPRPAKAPESPTKAPKVEKMSTFSRVFASPKKRKELELRQQLEAAQVKEQKPKPKQPTAWDLLNGLVARDGSFARAYICLSDHEKQAYGRSYTVDVPCYNEWASEDTTTSSVKSKRSQIGDGLQRRPPYQVGKLELQLLYVPKPKGAKDEDMPKSMNACIREMKEAENTATKNYEGHLSQQGGDCPVCSHPTTFPQVSILTKAVLATPSLQAFRLETDCLPRHDPPASRNHQSRQSR